VIADSIGITAETWLLGLGINGLLLVGSYWIARHGCKQPRGLNRAMATAVVFWTACTVGSEILGISGALARVPLLGWVILVAAIGYGLRWLRASVDRDPPHDATNGPLSWDELISLSLTLWASLLLGMRSLLLGVKVVSDGPIYHLYFAVRWWKAGRLLLVAAPFGENAATYFPANGDLWFAWLTTTWGGDRLARIGQVPFLYLASMAAFGCARLLGASRAASLVATCWFASSMPLLVFSFEPNVDTIFVAGYLLAAFFFLQAQRASEPFATYCLGALAAGLALATKPTAVVFIPPLLAVAIVGILVQSIPTRTKIVHTAVIALLPLVSGGFWFMRNWVLTGNPLYPLELRLLGRSVLTGWYGPEAMRTSPYFLPITDWRALGDILLAVLDPRLTPIWIASLFMGWAIKSTRTEGSNGRIAIFAALAVLNVALYWICIPYRTQQRFMLQALGLAVVPLAVLFDRGRWLRHAATFVLALHILTPQAWPFVAPGDTIPWDLTPLIPNAVGAPVMMSSRIVRAFESDLAKRSVVGLACAIGSGLAAFAMVWAWSRVAPRSPRFGGVLSSAVVSSVLFLGLGYLDVWRDLSDSRLDFYPAFPDFFAGWLNLEYRSGSSGARVAYAGTNIPYYLMARGLRNEVRYINIDRHRDWLLHDYHRSALARGHGHWANARPGWDRMQPDFQAWLDNLDAEGIELLVVTRANPGEGAHNVADVDNFPIERGWADSHPERFEILYGRQEHDPWFRLYRVRRSKAERSGRVDLTTDHGPRRAVE
jgi:hypothetical protein